MPSGRCSDSTISAPSLARLLRMERRPPEAQGLSPRWSTIRAMARSVPAYCQGHGHYWDKRTRRDGQACKNVITFPEAETGSCRPGRSKCSTRSTRASPGHNHWWSSHGRLLVVTTSEGTAADGPGSSPHGAPRSANEMHSHDEDSDVEYESSSPRSSNRATRLGPLGV